jgi:hypothetical protein
VPISVRSSAVNSRYTAPKFLPRRWTFVVSEIGTIQDLWAKSQPRVTCAGVPSLRSEMHLTKSSSLDEDLQRSLFTEFEELLPQNSIDSLVPISLCPIHRQTAQLLLMTFTDVEP